jgi:hypothetical protein
VKFQEEMALIPDTRIRDSTWKSRKQVTRLVVNAAKEEIAADVGVVVVAGTVAFGGDADEAKAADVSQAAAAAATAK